MSMLFTLYLSAQAVPGAAPAVAPAVAPASATTQDHAGGAAETSAAKNNSVPVQNQSKPVVESIKPYDAEALVKNLNGEGGEADATILFFPADAFNLVKGIKDPGAYHKQLVSWFAADIKREQERLKPGAPWSVDSFKLGSCKWKEKGSEANALPYWSCYKSKLKLKNAKNESNLVEIRVLINWGDEWYPTHLGPIPKAK